MTISFPSFHNGEPIPLASIPRLSMREFRAAIISAVSNGATLTALFGTPMEDGRIQLIGVLADSVTSSLSALSTEVDESYPCLTLECPQAHWFEREIAEQWKVEPQGHPWLKPIRFHAPYRTDGVVASASPRSNRFLRDRRRRSSRGRRRPRTCRNHRAGAFSLPMSRRAMFSIWRYRSATSIAASNGLSWADRASARFI